MEFLNTDREINFYNFKKINKALIQVIGITPVNGGVKIGTMKAA